MELKLSASLHKALHKFRIKTCLNVANARVAFHSRAGIASIAKVGLKDENSILHAKRSTVLLDDLFICDACDRAGVPDLIRSSGKHIEDHHLIRCQAPEVFYDPISPTEQRLLSLESRFDGVQTHLEDLSSCMRDLAGHIKDLNARIGNIEQLLRLSGATE